jgi:hypothetical protein
MKYSGKQLVPTGHGTLAVEAMLCIARLAGRTPIRGGRGTHGVTPTPVGMGWPMGTNWDLWLLALAGSWL